jgi:putative transposase
MGLALRIGIRCYGAFQTIYTDNGRPELSRYLQNILDGMKIFGMTWDQADPREVNPSTIPPGTHRKTNVGNPPAKLIEKTLRDLEEIMESHFRLPGRTRRLTDDTHWQEIDQKEAEALAKSGKLLLASEHALMVYRAADYYNNEKSHRSVIDEWIWKPKPSKATPHDCLVACYRDGWRPRKISEKAADLIFLARDDRVVRLGRIEFRGDFYEHKDLIGIEGRVDLRFDPMDLSEILVFHQGKYLCTAIPVEYSSMKDMPLAQRKIREKRDRAKGFVEEYKRLTSPVPDIRQYSTVPKAERVAALVGREKKKRALVRGGVYRIRTDEELEAEIKNQAIKLLPAPRDQKPLPERPTFFRTDTERYLWCRDYHSRGGALNKVDSDFLAEYTSKMSPAEARLEEEYWAGARELHEQNGKRGGQDEIVLYN